MRKIAFFVSLFLLPFLGLAQNTSLGLRGGLNFTNFTGDDASGSMLLGFNGGAFVTYSVNRNWGITGEINYSGKGNKPEFEGANIKSTRLNYLEVPVYVSYFFEGDKLRPKLFAGGTYANLMSAQNNRENGDDTDVKDQFESNEFGAVFGAGLHYRFTGENWFIFDVRYNLGLTDITVSENSDIRNGGFSINVGVSFPLGNY